jgi:hypothetical protein
MYIHSRHTQHIISPAGIHIPHLFPHVRSIHGNLGRKTRLPLLVLNNQFLSLSPPCLRFTATMFSN